ncbi:hypothetical protein EB796_021210 [Bugula neritina]|uniref:Uncharacterized protein n=1 Tax=Bugula neritina TaxID=10212 RepID=A0A7J7J312_BUGNE|nr:hypothetical protein EB796_021210 [Bugula neritina]
MNTPIYNHDFVETEAAKDVDKVLEVPGSSIIVLTGAPGRGKSYIAGHKSAKVWDNLKESGKRLYRKFDCTSIEALYSDLHQLLKT